MSAFRNMQMKRNKHSGEEKQGMKTIQNINQGWLFFEGTYPDGVCVTADQWNPTAASSIWDGVTALPVLENGTPVDLPHIWNVEEPNAAGPRYYTRILTVEDPGEGEYFISFEAVTGFSRIWLNGKVIGEHKGGFSRFTLPLKGLRNGENQIAVLTDNTSFCDISPYCGDFNKFGGIYRDVEFIQTGTTHFDLCYYGTCGVELLAWGDGRVDLKSHIVGETASTKVRYTVFDESNAIAAQTESAAESVQLCVEAPALWKGRESPCLYRMRAELYVGNEIVDEAELNFGFRSVELSSEQGFLLNLEHLRLNGVARHQDREGRGWAVSREELREDMDFILELGANAVRLSHYQHPDFFYELCDREGIVAWAEIPMLGMQDKNPVLQANAVSQLKELILQNRHHPSICFWGVQNEIAMRGESLEMYKKVRELNATVKELAPNGLSACANLYIVKNSSELNFITDMVGYNIYYGWYYEEMDGYTKFFERFHKENPQVALGVSEYGVDSNIQFHTSAPKRKDYSEEFQSLFHETVYPQIQAQPWLWGSFVWNLFEFGSTHRNDDAGKGLNRKGLVTYDRKTRKDAFYYYKACWSKQPFLHLCGSSFEKRSAEETEIKVYGNVPQVSLYVNGELAGTGENGPVYSFRSVALRPGENTVTAVSGDLKDEIVLLRTEAPEKSYIYVDPNPDINVKDWFTPEEGEEKLFPKDRFSLMDEMCAIYQNPEAWAVLEREIPELIAPEHFKKSSMPLLRTLNRFSGNYSEQFFKDLNKMLNEVKK